MLIDYTRILTVYSNTVFKYIHPPWFSLLIVCYCVCEREKEKDRQKELEYHCNEMKLFLFKKFN